METNKAAFNMISDRITSITDQIDRADIDDSVYIRVKGNVYGPYKSIAQMGLESVFAFVQSLDGETHIDIINNSGSIIKDASYEEEETAVETEIQNLVNNMYDLWENEIVFSTTNQEYLRQAPLAITDYNGISADIVYSNKGQFIVFETSLTRMHYVSIYSVDKSKWEIKLYKGNYRVQRDFISLYRYKEERLEFDTAMKQIMHTNWDISLEDTLENLLILTNTKKHSRLYDLGLRTGEEPKILLMNMSMYPAYFGAHYATVVCFIEDGDYMETMVMDRVTGKVVDKGLEYTIESSGVLVGKVSNKNEMRVYSRATNGSDIVSSHSIRIVDAGIKGVECEHIVDRNEHIVIYKTETIRGILKLGTNKRLDMQKLRELVQAELK